MLIVAAGKGIRMKSDIPKQFTELNGKPLLMQTIDAFPYSFRSDQLILVIPNDSIGFWKELCAKHQFHTPHNTIEGGPQRYHSVKRGLSMIPDGALVAIHDAVRPFVSKEVISHGFSIAEKKGNAIPALHLDESIREVLGSLNKAADRDRYRKVQTPQFFHSTLIKKAYQQSYDERFTDDATVLESSGQQIYLFDGDPLNLKITTPEDLMLAELRIKSDL